MRTKRKIFRSLSVFHSRSSLCFLLTSFNKPAAKRINDFWNCPLSDLFKIKQAFIWCFVFYFISLMAVVKAPTLTCNLNIAEVRRLFNVLSELICSQIKITLQRFYFRLSVYLRCLSFICLCENLMSSILMLRYSRWAELEYILS